MPNTVVFLWISGAAGLAVPPPHVVSDLRDFGAARGLSFVAVSDARPLGLPANDTALVDVIEGELEQARTALSALEEANARTRLHKVEALLLAHSHLPQASFLMGECLALQAQAARASSPAQAAELEARRLALEGPRAAAFGEPESPLTAPSSVTLDVRGLGGSDELELDGVRRAGRSPRVSVAPGLHHARVWRGDRIVFATFVQVSSGQTWLGLDVPALTPCSAEDLGRVARVSGTGAPAPTAVPPGIACAHWARVREDGAGVAVALCERSQCGTFQHWQRREPPPFAPIGPSATERRGFPAWASFALAGGAAVVASSIVLWQSGAFERGRPNAATWEYGGLNPQGIRF